MVDQVKVAATEEATSEQSLRRNLTNRHIQLIAIGVPSVPGCLWAQANHQSCRAVDHFVYMIIGFMLFFVMRAMGELLLSNLEYKSFSDFASDLLGPWAGLFHRLDLLVLLGRDRHGGCRRHYRLCAVLVPGLSDWGRLAGGDYSLLSLNLATVKMFGEMEFWFAMIKIVAIVALIVVGSDNGADALPVANWRTGFTHLWNDGGWFPKGISGFAGFQIAVFAFVGIELVGTTAAETKDPEKLTACNQLHSGSYHHVLRLCVFDHYYVRDAVELGCAKQEPICRTVRAGGMPAAASLLTSWC